MTKSQQLTRKEVMQLHDEHERFKERMDVQKQWLDEIHDCNRKTVEHVYLYAAFRNTQSQQIEQGAFIDGYFSFARDVEERRPKHERQTKAALHKTA